MLNVSRKQTHSLPRVRPTPQNRRKLIRPQASTSSPLRHNTPNNPLQHLQATFQIELTPLQILHIAIPAIRAGRGFVLQRHNLCDGALGQIDGHVL